MSEPGEDTERGNGSGREGRVSGRTGASSRFRALLLDALGIAGGLGLALAFPRAGVAPLAWLAPVPWLVRLPGFSALRGLRSGYLFGLGFFALLLNWVHSVLTRYTSLPLFLTLPIWLLLVGYLAIYPALFGGVVAGLCRRAGPAALLLAPFAWVACEFARGRLLGGFPWGSAGYARAGGLALLQAASIGGVLLVSFLLASAWSALAILVLAFVRSANGASAAIRGADAPVAARAGPARAVCIAAVLILVIVAAAPLIGLVRLHAHPAAGSGLALAGPATASVPAIPDRPGFRVVLVQGGYGGDLDYEEGKRALEDYLDLTRRSAAWRPSLIVWPESNAPFQPLETPGYLDLLQALRRETGADLLLGGIGGTERDGLTNSAFLVGGETGPARYDKRRLVPYGEFVPFQELFPFVRHFVVEAGEFRPGRAIGVLRSNGIRIGVSICYEMVFAEEIGAQARAGADVLVNLTNDSWYRRGGPWQHSDFAPVRAIETGLYTARVAGTGRTLFIDPFGRTLASGPIGGKALILGEMPGREGSGRTLRTAYARWGDWPGPLCVTITSVALAFLGVGNIIDRRRMRERADSRT